jgi:hypothetical protein
MQQVRAVSYQQLERRVGLYEGERESAAVVRERFRRMVTTQRTFDEGQSAYAGRNRLEQAQNRFETARSEFAAAGEYQSRLDPPASFRPVVRRSSCYCETMARASLRFREATAARRNGNDDEADRLRNRPRQAEDGLSECNLRG